jgi:hypothetical protein
MKVRIDANGNFPLAENGSTLESKITINAPAVIGGTIAVGYLDATGTFVPYLDGALLAGESKVYNTGVGANVVANITGFTASFFITTHDTRSR